MLQDPSTMKAHQDTRGKVHTLTHTKTLPKIPQANLVIGGVCLDNHSTTPFFVGLSNN